MRMAGGAQKEKTPIVFFQCSFCHYSSLDVVSADTPEGLLERFAEHEEPTAEEKAFGELLEALKKKEHDAALQERKRRKRSLYRTASALRNEAARPRVGDAFQTLAAAQKAKEEAISFQGKLAHTNNEQTSNFAVPDADPSALATSTQEVVRISQRLAGLSHQNSGDAQSSTLLPYRKLLMTKKSRSCAKCDKVLVKPGINPSQVQFDLRHLAWLFLPRFRLIPQDPIQWRKQSTCNLRMEVQHRVQEFMYFRIQPLDHVQSTKLLLESSEEYQYILPYEFDPDVDVELQEKLESLQKSHTDPSWITERSGHALQIQLPFEVQGEVGSLVEIRFSVAARFALPTGPQETSFEVVFQLGTVSE